MLSAFELVAGLITLTAAFAWLNERFLSLPRNIGLLIIGLAASLLLVGFELLFPRPELYGAVQSRLKQIDFYGAVMYGVLAFLLFAGAIQLDLTRLRNRAPVVALMATAGVLLSATTAAVGFYLVSRLAGFDIPFAWAFVFGTVIAPTDPVAVLATLKATKVPTSLETDLSGEALFNDGIAIALFLIAMQIATHEQGAAEPLAIAELFLREACGGALLGLATGYVVYLALRSIDDYPVEIMVSLALVMGTYALALELHVSGPISVVVAGVLVGNRGARHAMSDVTKRYFFGFWTLADDVLNAILFLLIGLEVLVLNYEPSIVLLGLAGIPIALMSRFCAVALPVTLLRRWICFSRGTVPVLTWGGVRGGISVALALSLPYSEARPLILGATYSIVLFSIVVQGLTLGNLARRVAGPPSRTNEGEDPR